MFGYFFVFWNSHVNAQSIVQYGPGITGPGWDGAVFPCCTLSVPLARPLYMGRAYDISITVEVWADKQLDAVRLFEQLRAELEKLNLRQTGNVPSQQDDITEKWRFGG